MNTLVNNSRLFNWFLAVAWASAIFLMSSQPAPAEPMFRLPPYTDKIIHALIYAVLASLIFRAMYMTGFSKTAAVVLSILFASLYGVSDEWHQSMVAGRTQDIFDWVADTVGALYVIFLARNKV